MYGYEQKRKSSSCVVKIKGKSQSFVSEILDKIAELNSSGFRVVHGFIQRDRDGTGFVVFVNVLRSHEEGA